MQKSKFFPYSWFVDEDETECTCIRVYGLNERNENVCVRVDDFYPYCYIELPVDITESMVYLIRKKIDELLGRQKETLDAQYVLKKKLYRANFDKNGQPKLFPFLLCYFANKEHIKSLVYLLRKPLMVSGIGRILLKVHEDQANPILQFVCNKNISTAGWISFSGKKQTEENKITLCENEYVVSKNRIGPFENPVAPKPKIMGFDIEVYSSNNNAMPKSVNLGDKIFQISCVFTVEGDYNENNYTSYLISLGEPKQSIVGEEVNIINCNTEADVLIAFVELIRTENPNIICGYNIFGFDIPYMIDRANVPCMIPDIFAKQGFHKTNMAKKRKISWSSSAYKNQEFEFLDAEGRLYVDLLPLVKRDYKFNNYKLKTIAEYFIGQTKDPLSVKGIFKCYKLGIKRKADGTYPIQAQKAMGIVGKYCVKDSALVVSLVGKLQVWYGLTEMASICNVPIFTLYTQGQQIKVFSQIYRHCLSQNIVVESNGYEAKDNERYVGAYVFDPVPGSYNMVVPLDFCSLYPSIIIGYNIDYSTWVTDESIPNRKCNVMEWEDHIGCEHDEKVIRVNNLNTYIKKREDEIKELRELRDSKIDKFRRKEIADEIKVKMEELKPYKKERSDIKKTISKHPMCEKRRYRFLKEPKGILPTIIQNLLDARKNTRKEINKYKDRIKAIKNGEMKEDNEFGNSQALSTLCNVLDKRQLALKVSANSMYGALGVKRGYLPLMPGAMCVTYMGRTNIQKVSRDIQEIHNGKLVYGDTDSNYVCFPHLTTAEETWAYALKVADEISMQFPPPVRIDFEEAIYSFFFILTKKRYMYRACDAKGNINKKIGKKGVLLARRDNSKYVRDVYENVISKIADGINCEDILYYIIQEINDLLSHSKPLEDFIVTKSVGNAGNIVEVVEDPDSFKVESINEKTGKRSIKIQLGDYKVPPLSKKPKEKQEQFKKKKVDTDEEYYLSCLPAQVQLAIRMKNRGMIVPAGTRLEYVIAYPNNQKGKLYDKVEDVEYIKKHGDIIKLDYMYYLKNLVVPLDQMCNVAFKNVSHFKPDFVKNQFLFRIKNRERVLNELKDIFSPKIVFID